MDTYVYFSSPLFTFLNKKKSIAIELIIKVDLVTFNNMFKIVLKLYSYQYLRYILNIKSREDK